MPKKVANAAPRSLERQAVDAEPANDVEKSDRGQWDKNAAEIDRMIDNNEESKKYEMNEISQEALGQLQGNVPETKKIIILREDIELIAAQLETSRTFAENALLKHDGDVKAAIRTLVGF